MIKKLIISAIVLTALVAGKEANAAGPGSFARSLSGVPALHMQVAQNRTHGAERSKTISDFTIDQAAELKRVNEAVDGTLAAVDGYLDTFAGDLAVDQDLCLDCADLKRDHLVSIGWDSRNLSIGYALNDEGRIERVLVVATPRGDIVLSHGGLTVDRTAQTMTETTKASEALPAPAATADHYDI
jgi:predicted transglutaminase-like cysteine proteinase